MMHFKKVSPALAALFLLWGSMSLAAPPPAAAGAAGEELPEGWTLGPRFFSEMQKHNAVMYTNAAREVNVGYTELYSLEYGSVEGAMVSAAKIYSCKRGKKVWGAETLTCDNDLTLYFFERNDRVVMLTSDFTTAQQEKEVRAFIGHMYFGSFIQSPKKSPR